MSIAIKGVNILAILLVALGLVVIFFRYFERQTIFYPTRGIDFSPKELGLDFEDVFLNTADNFKLHGWLVPAKEATCYLLFCHGNAGNLSHRLEKIKFFHNLGLNIFIFDYRGYGRSRGRPSERGLYKDVQAAYDYLLSRNINPGQIIGYGESLGSAIIINLASRNKLKALIIEGGFTDARDIAKVAYPYLPSAIISTRLDSEDKIKTIKIPKLIIHSLNDEIVPYPLGRKLYDSAAPPKEFLEIHGGHNTCFFESEGILKDKLSDFFKRL
ncbi:MAG TPA: alpha/beta hydrolase [Candidatus Omnitrophota bacterium]|nr:alpha/beta hydrolase [Candidatus Omnitrophota bacterium]